MVSVHLLRLYFFKFSFDLFKAEGDFFALIFDENLARQMCFDETSLCINLELGCDQNSVYKALIVVLVAVTIV